MSKFETRKKLLVAESEVYRQLLKLELETFKVYGKRTSRRLTSMSTVFRIAKTGLPFLANFFATKRRGSSSGSSLKRMGSLFLIGWQAYQRFRPFFGPGKFRAANQERTTNAAEEYLSRRL